MINHWQISWFPLYSLNRQLSIEVAYYSFTSKAYDLQPNINFVRPDKSCTSNSQKKQKQVSSLESHKTNLVKTHSKDTHLKWTLTYCGQFGLFWWKAYIFMVKHADFQKNVIIDLLVPSIPFSTQSFIFPIY